MHGVERLAMEVRFLDRVMIDDHDTADAGAREILQDRAAEPTCADHQDRRRSQPLLADGADLAEHGLAGITVGHAACLIAAIQALAWAMGSVLFTMSPTTAGESAPGLRQNSARSRGRPPLAINGRLATRLFNSPMRPSPLGAN